MEDAGRTSSQVMLQGCRLFLVLTGVLFTVSWQASAAMAFPGAHIVLKVSLPDRLPSLFTVQIDDLPAATTAISLERVHYEPGVELSEQPIDGPRLLLIESGVLSLEFARSGALRFTPDATAEAGIDLAAGQEHEFAGGEIVLIPAGIPLQLANRSAEPVSWLQLQAETPPTICACGEDLTGSQTDLLASKTLEQPLAAPSMLTVSLAELAPRAGASAPPAGIIQLVAAVGESDTLVTGSDGLARNGTTRPIPIYVVTLGARATT